MSAFLAAAFYGLWLHRRLPKKASRAECAEWLHDTCARGLRAIDVQLEVHGQPPTSGLIVSNHLTYLDILAYSAAVPCVFVSKSEVEQWPIFGLYARWSASVFVRRHDRGDVARTNLKVEESLKDAVPVVLFPEGTTTDGHQVLRFHSTMLKPAINAGTFITASAIGYALEDGDAGREAAWWGTMPLLPHLLNLLGKKTIRARITFADPIAAAGDRKQLGHVLHDKVTTLHAEIFSGEQPALIAESNASLGWG